MVIGYCSYCQYKSHISDFDICPNCKRVKRRFINYKQIIIDNIEAVNKSGWFSPNEKSLLNLINIYEWFGFGTVCLCSQPELKDMIRKFQKILIEWQTEKFTLY